MSFQATTSMGMRCFEDAYRRVSHTLRDSGPPANRQAGVEYGIFGNTWLGMPMPKPAGIDDGRM